MRVNTIALLLSLVLSTGPGCSSTSLKSTPIWDDDFARAEGPAEDRINVWPLLYYRRPALSILWPLFSSTDEGHELLPLYAYERGPRELRLGSLLPWLPAAAQLEPEYTRVLGVVSDRKQNAFAVLPFYYGTPDGFWTPPWTRFRKADRRIDGWLAPAALHVQDADEDSWYVAWPLLSRWREGESSGLRAFPLFWHERGPQWSWLNVAGLLYHRTTRGEHYTWSPPGTDSFWLWPLGASRRAGNTRSSRFLPFWYWKADGQESLFATLPYLERRAGERTWRSIFGLVHGIRDRDGSGHALLPLYWRYRGESTQTLLTLAGGYSRGPDDELLDVLGPVYWSRRRQDTRTTAVLWPLFRNTSQPGSSETSLLLGAAGAGSGALVDGGSRLWAYPFFQYRAQTLETTFPSNRLARSETSFWSIPFQVERVVHEPAAAELRVRATLSCCVGKLEDRRGSEPLSSVEVSGLLGMAGMRVTELLAGSIDASGEAAFHTATARRSWLRPLWLLPIWEQSSSERDSSSELLWRLYDSQTRLQDDGLAYTRQRILWRLLHRETLGTRHSIDVFPFVSYDRDADLLQWSFMGGLLGWRSTSEERVARLLWIPLRP